MSHDNTDAPLRAYHCGGQGGWGGSRWGGGRDPEPMDVVLKPVYGKMTVVSLPHACLASGLLDDVHDGGPVNLPVLLALVEKKWGGDVDRFFADAGRVGVSRADSGDSELDCAEVIIGWAGADRRGLCHSDKGVFGIVADPCLAVAILARRVGDMYFGFRPPSYDWDSLFGIPFEFDEDVGPAPKLSEQPWASHEWKLGEAA